MKARSLWSKNFILINLSVIFASFTNFAYIYILPVHVLRIGGSNTEVGLMGAGLTLVGLITRLTMAPFIDKWGRKPMLILGILLFSLNSLGYLLLKDSVPGVIAMRCFSGFTQGILFPVPPTIVSDISPKEKLVDALGIFGIASSLPAMLAPVLGLYLYEQVGPAAFFGVALATSLLSILFAFLYRDEYRPQPAEKPAGERSRFRLGSVLELSILFPSLVFLLGCFGFSAANNFVLAFGESQGIAGMSLFFTVHNLAIVGTRLVAGRLRGLLSTWKIIFLGLVIIGSGTLLIAFARSLPVMLLASAIMGIGGTIYSQYLQADALLRVGDDRRGVANSTLMLAQDIGSGAGASVFGVTSEYLGYPVTFVAAAVVTWLAIPFSMKKTDRHPPAV